MAVVTLGEAARLPGLGKTTLARAIELARVYPFPAPTVAADTTVTATGPPRRPPLLQPLRARLWRWRRRLPDCGRSANCCGDSSTMCGRIGTGGGVRPSGSP